MKLTVKVELNLEELENVLFKFGELMLTKDTKETCSLGKKQLCKDEAKVFAIETAIGLIRRGYDE